MCPKIPFASKNRIEIAVAETICELSSNVKSSVISKHQMFQLGIKKNSVVIASKRDLKRE